MHFCGFQAPRLPLAAAILDCAMIIPAPSASARTPWLNLPSNLAQPSPVVPLVTLILPYTSGQ